MRFPKSKNLKWLSISIVAAVVAAMVVALLPGGVSVKADRGVLSIGVRTAYAQNPEPRPAYQVSIPHGVGSETGLKAYPPKLEVTGKDNWLAVQSPDGLDVPVGSYTYDTEGDTIAVDKYSGKIYVDLITNNLIITAGALSEKASYDIEVPTYTLYGGESQVFTKEDGSQKTVVTELRAKFRSYVYGSGSDLYLLEDTPQNREAVKREITAVRIYAVVKGTKAGATAETRILIGGKKYNGATVALTTTEQRIGTTYTTNPFTGLVWTWQDIDNLQAGVTLKTAEMSYVYTEVEFVVHSQTFYPITPVEVTPGTASAWTDVDVSASVPAGATGVVLHLVNTHASNNRAVGLRKNESTDDRRSALLPTVHLWAAIGVDASRIFEAYVGSTTEIDIYLVGYTVSGVTFFTNAYDKSLTTLTTWTDISAATEAPSATGLIFEGYTPTDYYNVGFRKNGSSDDRRPIHYRRLWVIVGCDTSQISEGYISNVAYDFFLIGYVTDGATFNTNATNVSLAGIDAWTDLAALPTNSVMGFIEVSTGTANSYYGLRKNGSSEDIYQRAMRYSWAFVECDASYLVEGKISAVAADFFVVGYATAEAAPAITVSPATYNFGVVIESSTPSTTTSYFTITNTSTMITNNTIGVTTSTWSGGVTWAHSETATAGSNQAGLLSNKGGTWGTGDVIVKYTSPNTIAANQAANTNWNFGLKLIAPTAFTDGVQKQIIVKITASAS